MRSRHRRLRYELLETRDLLTSVQISDEFVGHPASLVTVRVEIDDATGVRAAEIRIEYDTSQLDVQPKDITAGSAWDGKALVMANVDEQAGVIVVFAFATESLAEGSGSLIDVSFRIRSDARPTEAAIDLAELRLNEGQIELSAKPVPGSDTTDGLITLNRHNAKEFEGTVRDGLLQACVAKRGTEAQALFNQPLPPTATPHHLSSGLADKAIWLRHRSRFIGPVSDLIFASTQDWLRVR
jgi:hypothetical protein